MQEMNKRITLPYWINIICMVFMTFSLLHGYFSITARGWIWLPLACLTCLVLNKEVFKAKQFAWLVIYFLIVIINLMAGKSSSSNNFLVLEISMILWAISFPFIIKDDVNSKFVRAFVIIELMVVVITSFLNIITDFTHPGVVRQAVSYVNLGENNQAIALYRMGVCDYGFPHAVPIIVPAIIQYVKREGLSMAKRILSIALILLISYFVFISGVTTAVMLLLFSIIGSFLVAPGGGRKTNIRLIILLLVTIPLLSDEVILNALTGLENIVSEDNAIHGKIKSFEDTIKYEEASGSVEARENKYFMSWDAFLENPLLGSSSESTGGHSVILDIFGTYGILGGIPFLFLLFVHLKYIYKLIPKGSKYYFFIGSICFVMMFAIKNMSNVYTWMFVSALLPLMLLYGQKENTGQ